MAGILSKAFREAVSKHKDYAMKEESKPSVAYPTGFLNFDFANGTVVHVKDERRDFRYYSVGIQDGCIAMLIGRSGCGKTTFAVQAAANIVRPFPNACIYHDDIEGGITEYRKKLLTHFTDQELHDKYISRNTGITAENFYERIKMIYDIKMQNHDDYEYDTGCFDTSGNRIYKLVPTVYILDSIALLMPAKYTDEDELSGSMSTTAGAKTNAMLFRRIVPMLKAANIILILINHINQKIEINPMIHSKSQVAYLKQNETLPGGNTIIYLTNLLIRFDDNSKLKEDEAFGIAGNLVDIGLVKSRNNRAGRTCTLVFDQDKGFDPELSLFLMLKSAKRINGAGAYLYIGDRSDIKFSQKTFKQKLRENPEFRMLFIQEAQNLLANNLNSTIQEEEEVEAEENDISNDILSAINSTLLECK